MSAVIFSLARRSLSEGWLMRPGRSRPPSLSVKRATGYAGRSTTIAMSESSDSAVPAFWNQRYACGETPWTLHAIPATLRSFVKRTRARGRVLIPGCGTDHEVLRFLQSARSPRSIFQQLPSPKSTKRWEISMAKLSMEIFSNSISQTGLM